MESLDLRVSRPLFKRNRPLVHFARRLFRESDRQNRIRIHALLADEVGNLGRNHASLSAPRPRQNQKRASLVNDRLVLLRIQNRKIFLRVRRKFRRRSDVGKDFVFKCHEEILTEKGKKFHLHNHKTFTKIYLTKLHFTKRSFYVFRQIQGDESPAGKFRQV